MAFSEAIIEGIVTTETKADLKRIYAAFKSRWAELDAREDAVVRAVLKVGDKVTWHGRKGRYGHGTVTKINYAKALVTEDATGIKWNIPLAMLKVEGKEA